MIEGNYCNDLDEQDALKIWDSGSYLVLDKDDTIVAVKSFQEEDPKMEPGTFYLMEEIYTNAGDVKLTAMRFYKVVNPGFITHDVGSKLVIVRCDPPETFKV